MSISSFLAEPSHAAEAVRAAVRSAAKGLVGRDVLVELIALAAIAEEHLLVVGAPGTAKSEAARRTARALGGTYFEYLLGKFTEPSEIFGPVDLSKLQHGTVETLTKGMLPEADIVFLDEVFLGSTAILNTLLGVLNERRFRRGHTTMDVPLRVCVGASNALPEDATLSAFADRFLVRVFVAPVADEELERLLEAPRELSIPGAAAKLGDLDALSRARREVDLGGVTEHVAKAVRLLRKAGVVLTDRRIVRAQNLVAAAAALAGRKAATLADLWPLVYVAPTEMEQDAARDALRELLEATDSPLASAALDASSAPRVRARKLWERGEQLLANVPVAAEAPAWKLGLEAVLREIDAGFAKDALVEPLPALRERIGRALAAGA